MKIIESNLKDSIRDTYHLQDGNIYLINNFLISEFNQEVILDKDTLLTLFHIIKVESEKNNIVGYISNRVYDYNVNLVDFTQVNSHFPKTEKIAIVNYSERSKRATKFEIDYLKCKAQMFNNLEDAVNWVSKTTVYI